MWIAAFVLIRSPRARREWIEDRLEYLECYEQDDVPWLELIRQAMAAALILRGVFGDQARAVEKREKAAGIAGADGVAFDGTGTLDVTLSASGGVALTEDVTIRIGSAVDGTDRLQATEHLTVRAVAHVTATDVLIEPATE